MATISIADKFKAFLTNAWNAVDEAGHRPRYAAAVATKLIEFVDLSEKIFRNFSGRIKALEEGQAAILKALNITPTVPVNGHNEGAANGTARPPAAAGAGNFANMDRINALGDPMSPEERAEEEAADLAFNGELDASRYVPKGQRRPAPPPQDAGAPPQPPTAPPVQASAPAPTPPPAALAVVPKPPTAQS